MYLLDRVIRKAQLKGVHIDIDCDSDLYQCKSGRGNEYKFDARQDSNVKTSSKKNVFEALDYALELKQDLCKLEGYREFVYEIQEMRKDLKKIQKYLDYIGFVREVSFNKYDIELLFDKIENLLDNVKEQAKHYVNIQDYFNFEKIENKLKYIVNTYEKMEFLRKE